MTVQHQMNWKVCQKESVTSGKSLGRRLKFHEAQITEHDKNNDALSEKAYQLLLAWKGRDASAATYSVLHKALSSIERKDLAEEFCCQ